MKEPRCFSVMVQWDHNGMILQEDGLTWDDAFDAVQGYRTAKRPPYRCAMALVVKR